jgi:uncharacterized Tic20 family protein
MTPTDERTWGMWTHLGALIAWLFTGLLGWVVPLIIMQTRGQQSAFVRHQSVESLNFQLTLLIIVVVSIPLAFVIIGIFTLIAAGIIGIVFPILGSIAANRGEPYRYPLNFRMVK